MWRKENICALLVEVLISTVTVENSMGVSQKINNRTTIISSNSTFGNITKGNKNTNSKIYLHFHIHGSVIYNSQDLETT